jgi:hypothetical protein
MRNDILLIVCGSSFLASTIVNRVNVVVRDLV